jgi:hypothetical protein
MKQTQTFNVRVIPADIREKMARAARTASRDTQRDLRYPHCGFRLASVFKDSGGHYQLKCGKCKEETVFRLTPGTTLDFRMAET